MTDWAENWDHQSYKNRWWGPTILYILKDIMVRLLSVGDLGWKLALWYHVAINRGTHWWCGGTIHTKKYNGNLLSVRGWGWKLALCFHVAIDRGTRRIKLGGKIQLSCWLVIHHHRERAPPHGSTQPDWHGNGMALINNWSTTDTKCHIWTVMFACWYSFTTPPKRVCCIAMSAARDVNQNFYAALFVICKFTCKIEHLWDSDVLRPHIWSNISRLPTAMH